MIRFLYVTIKETPFTEWKSVVIIEAIGLVVIWIGNQIVGHSDAVRIRSKNITIKIQCGVWFCVFVCKKKFAVVDFRRRLNEKALSGGVCNDAINYHVWVRAVFSRNEHLDGLTAGQSFRFPIRWEFQMISLHFRILSMWLITQSKASIVPQPFKRQYAI